MAESVKCVLEVYSAATYSLSTPVRVKGGVVGDSVTYIVTASAVGSYTGTTHVVLTGAPTGAVVTYSPTNGNMAVGGSVTISVNTTSCSAGTSTMTITGSTV